jgi:hypothetical protein
MAFSMKSKINFKRFKAAEEVQSFFYSQLTLGVSTASNVITMLHDLELKHTELIDNSKYDKSYLQQMPIFCTDFEQSIGAFAQAKPTLFILRNCWIICFMFIDGHLARIDIRHGDIDVL